MRCSVPRASSTACGWMPPVGARSSVTPAWPKDAATIPIAAILRIRFAISLPVYCAGGAAAFGACSAADCEAPINSASYIGGVRRGAQGIPNAPDPRYYRFLLFVGQGPRRAPVNLILQARRASVSKDCQPQLPPDRKTYPPPYIRKDLYIRFRQR